MLSPFGQVSITGFSSLCRDTPLCLSVFDGLQRSWMLGSDVEPKVVLANNIKSNLVRVKNQLYND